MYRFLSKLTCQSTILVTLLALVAFASSTQAGSFRTRWDPVFNDAFTMDFGVNLGWKGSALIKVSDNCITASTEVSFAPDGSNSSCGGDATLESYVLSFYDAGNNDAPLGEEGTGSPPGLPNVTAVSFDALAVADGFALSGAIDAGAFFFGTSNSFQAFLDFGVSTGPQLKLVENCGRDECPAYDDEYGAEITWSKVGAVPTPTSIALVGIGLAGLGFSRRRQKT